MADQYTLHTAERMTKFGQNLCGTHYGWKTDFARKLDMTPQALKPYLDGVRHPGITVLARLYKLGCSADWVLFGKSIITNIETK